MLPNRNTQHPIKQDESKLISNPKETIKETIKENTTAASEKKHKINFNARTGKFEGIDASFLERLKETFPRAKIEAEIKKAELWLYANPTKRKKNYKRFIASWLTRSEKGEQNGKNNRYNARYVPLSNEKYESSGDAEAGEW